MTDTPQEYDNARKEKFSAAYTAGLHDAVKRYPSEYALGNLSQFEYAQRTASRMLSAIYTRGISSVNVSDSRGMRNACKRLGISYSAKSIEAFLLGQ